MILQDLQHGMTIVYRLSNRDNKSGTSPEWDDWTKGKLYLRRRETPLPPKMRKKSKEPNVGDIIELCLEDIGWAEYSQSDYVGNGQFMVENYRMEIKGLA